MVLKVLTEPQAHRELQVLKGHKAQQETKVLKEDREI